MSVITIEVTDPRNTHPVKRVVHLAGETDTGGTGPCLCGFDRFARGTDGEMIVGFSVGGGVTGRGVGHRICRRCAHAASLLTITGTHAGLFEDAGAALRDRDGDLWVLGDDGLMHSPETAPFTREHVERKWGPLTREGEPIELIVKAIGAIQPHVKNNTAAWNLWNVLASDDDFVQAIVTIDQARRTGKGDHLGGDDACFGAVRVTPGAVPHLPSARTGGSGAAHVSSGTESNRNGRDRA